MSIREMVWKAVAFQMEAETPMTGSAFTVEDIVATVWEWNHEALRAAGLSKQDVWPVALAVLDHIEAHGWDQVRDEFHRAARLRTPEPSAGSEVPPRGPVGPIDPPF